MSGEDKYIVHYFDAKGLAEPIRIILSYAGVNWEDKRIPLPTVPTPVPDDIKAISPFGQVPLLEVNGQVLSQSATIARFLAKKYGLVGEGEWESAKCDEYADAAKDLITLWQQIHKEKNEDKKVELKKQVLMDSVRYLKKFNEILETNNGYLVGKNLTWVDIYLAHFLDNIELIYNVQITEGYAALKKLIETVYATPKIKEWIEKRPNTNF